MKRRFRTGFTLVELLVVIGIIAVLIGLLLPALNKARAASKATVCMSNLRTLGQCIYIYSNDSKGVGFFFAYNTAGGVTPSVQQFWFAAHINNTSWDPTQGYLTKYYKDPTFLICPSSEDYKMQRILGGEVPITTYAYNAWVPLLATKISQLQKTSETLALMDAMEVLAPGVPVGVYASNPPYPGKSPTLHGRHAGRGNVLWYDGHVSAETPYITDKAGNLGIGPSDNTDFIDHSKLGYLTALRPIDTPESKLMKNPTTSRLNYYYWVNKDLMN